MSFVQMKFIAGTVTRTHPCDDGVAGLEANGLLQAVSRGGVFRVRR